MTPVELIKFDIKCSLQILGHNEQEIRMTGDVVEPDLHIPESEFNFAGVPILMKATKTFHIENRVSAKLFFFSPFAPIESIVSRDTAEVLKRNERFVSCIDIERE